ncbi:MAG: hypothetical protein PHQ40_03655 [Anaerolineaceae bacterium]|nr:hypothetical protein [Anaerolineaceae bacterium]
MELYGESIPVRQTLGGSEIEMIGILAYGSLITDPGEEIQQALDRTLRDIETRFPVEYARTASSRTGAPTLVPVPEGHGSRVRAAVLVLRVGISLQQAENILYRRELNRVGDRSLVYRPRTNPRPDTLIIDRFMEIAGLDEVIAVRFPVNLPEILDSHYDDHEKAEILSIRARNSLNGETYQTRRDGISYLDANIKSGIITR